MRCVCLTVVDNLTVLYVLAANRWFKDAGWGRIYQFNGKSTDSCYSWTGLQTRRQVTHACTHTHTHTYTHLFVLKDVLVKWSFFTSVTGVVSLHHWTLFDLVHVVIFSSKTIFSIEWSFFIRRYRCISAKIVKNYSRNLETTKCFFYCYK